MYVIITAGVAERRYERLSLFRERRVKCFPEVMRATRAQVPKSQRQITGTLQKIKGR